MHGYTGPKSLKRDHFVSLIISIEGPLLVDKAKRIAFTASRLLSGLDRLDGRASFSIIDF